MIFHQILHEGLTHGSRVEFSFKGIWTWGIPYKVSFFLWASVLDNILSLNHHKSRGWNLANRCYLCMKEKESVDHLLFITTWCKRSRISFTHLNISWVFPNTIEIRSLDGGLKYWRIFPILFGVFSLGLFVGWFRRKGTSFSLRISTLPMSASLFGFYETLFNWFPVSKDFDNYGVVFFVVGSCNALWVLFVFGFCPLFSCRCVVFLFFLLSALVNVSLFCFLLVFLFFFFFLIKFHFISKKKTQGPNHFTSMLQI